MPFYVPLPFFFIEALHLFALLIFLITSCHSWLCSEEEKKEGRVWRGKEEQSVVAAWKMRGSCWNLRVWWVCEAETETSCSDVVLVFKGIVKVTFQTHCLLFKKLLKSFCHPGFVKTDHAVVNLLHLYSELGTNVHRKHSYGSYLVVE